MRLTFLIVFLGCALPISPASADREASNIPYVKSAQYGRCYTKAVPELPYNSLNGTTQVYRVTKSKDELIQSYAWYSQQVHIWCIGPATEASVVRMGPWNRGSVANSKDLSIAFYYGKKGLLKRYSTLEIAAGDSTNVSSSASHYNVIRKVIGFRRAESTSNNAVFEIETVDQRRIIFDVLTGEMISVSSITKLDEK